MLGERLTTLLSLISQDEYKTVDEFAQKMSLSTKTVRGLLQELNEQLQTHGAFPNIYRNGTLAWSTQHWKKTRRNTNLHRCWWNFWNRKTITSRMWG